MVDAQEARHREKSFIENLSGAQDDYDWIIEHEAWAVLGHASFADWWELRIRPLMRALQMKPVREIAKAGVKQVQQEEARLPPAQRRTQQEVGAMFGVPQRTISDWSRSTPKRNRYDNNLGRSGISHAPTMLNLRTHTGEAVEYPKPQSKPTFNESTGEGISWAAWSWNPVTGCLHGCDYCYAREIATSERAKPTYPVGFTPLFHSERLDAPLNTTIPERQRNNLAYRRVFVCSMADLYGRWVPDDWINQIHKSMLAAPQWEYLLLTKFPARYVGLDLPPNAWVGTSVDEQKRVRIAENAFRQIDDVKVKWLSLEPLREPLEFSDLSMFDWVVIGAQTETRQPNGVVSAFQPPWQWVIRITQQAVEAGCKVHWKPNLHHAPGMEWPDQYPET